MKKLEQTNLGLFQHILYIEQPLPRRLALDDKARKWIGEIGKLKPLIIDESDGSIGAYRRDIARMVIKRALGAVLLGLGLGLAGAYAATWTVRGLLFGVGAADPATFATGAVVLLATALLAASLPMRRAVRVDPMNSLRNE